MISLPDLLQRLRRAWAPPGPALTRIAPPADRAARLRAEVQPLLELIAAVQQSADAVRTDAEKTAARLVEAATQDAARKVREAEGSASTARAAAAKRKQDEMDAEIGRITRAAEERVAGIEVMSKERLAGLVGEVTACVLSGAGIDA